MPACQHASMRNVYATVPSVVHWSAVMLANSVALWYEKIGSQVDSHVLLGRAFTYVRVMVDQSVCGCEFGVLFNSVHA